MRLYLYQKWLKVSVCFLENTTKLAVSDYKYLISKPFKSMDTLKKSLLSCLSRYAAVMTRKHSASGYGTTSHIIADGDRA